MANTFLNGGNHDGQFIKMYKNAVFMSENRNEKSYFFIKHAISVVVTVVIATGLCIFVYGNIPILMMYLMLDIPFECDYVGLIVFGIGMVILIITAFVDFTGFDKRQEKWVTQVTEKYIS